MENLVVFDLETTGLVRDKDQIIQFAGIKVNKETNNIISELNLYIQPQGNYTINIAAYYKHKITPDFLKDKPYFYEVAPQIIEFLSDSDILTYNGTSFDIPFLICELNKAGYSGMLDFTNISCYDAFMEEKRRNGNSLGDTYKRYIGKSMEDSGLAAHDALADVKATYSVYFAQQEKQSYGPEQMFGEDNVIKIMNFQNKEVPCFNIGKYKGISVEFVSTFDKNYLKWATSDKSSFFESTKKYINKFI